MCIMSAVYDHFQPRIPGNWDPPVVPGTFTLTSPPFESPEMTALRQEVATLRQIVADFRAAVEHAAKLDRLMRQPDCVDPDKARLEARVAELERRLDAASKAFAVP